MFTLKSITGNLAIALIFSLFLISCSSDEADGNGTLKLSAKTSVNNSSAKTASTSKSINTDVFVSDFRVNIAEFELELDESEYEAEGEIEIESGESEFEFEWEIDGYYDYEDEFELEGPFELDLLAGEINFLTVDVPNGDFEELEFKVRPEASMMAASWLRISAPRSSGASQLLDAHGGPFGLLVQLRRSIAAIAK